MSIVPSSRKIPAGLLGIFLGQFGIHKFYMGMYRAGAIMLILDLMGWATTCFFGVGWIILAAVHVVGFAEGIIYLVRSDSDFFNTYFVRRQEWF